MTDEEYNEELFKTFEKSLEDMKLAIEKYKTDADKRVNKIIELCDISPPPMVEEEELKCLGFRPQSRIGECEGCKAVCEECENLMIMEEEVGNCGSCDIELDHLRDGTTEDEHRCSDCYWTETIGYIPK